MTCFPSAAACLLSLCLLGPLPAATVVLVRHAERAGSTAPDVPLSAAGVRRAQALARTLADAGVTTIFTSEVKRTQQTAEPLMQRLGIKLTVVPASDVTGLVKRIQQLPSQAVVLVVGHSNTVPAIVKELGESVPPLAEEEFDRLIIVRTGAAHSKPTVLTLRYGPEPATPPQ